MFSAKDDCYLSAQVSFLTHLPWEAKLSLLATLRICRTHVATNLTPTAASGKWEISDTQELPEWDVVSVLSKCKDTLNFSVTSMQQMEFPRGLSQDESRPWDFPETPQAHSRSSERPPSSGLLIPVCTGKN